MTHVVELEYGPSSEQTHRLFQSGAINNQPTFRELDTNSPTEARYQITIGAIKTRFSHSDLDNYSLAEGSNAENDMLYWSVLDRRDFVERFSG